MIESYRWWGAAALMAVTWTGLVAGCQGSSSTAVGSSVGTSAGSPSSGGSSSGPSGGSSTGGRSSDGTSTGSSSGGQITDGGACPTGSQCLLSDGGLSICCNSTCPDVFDDRQNCGGCGSICQAGATCSGGACIMSSCAGVAPYSPGLLASLSKPVGVGCIPDGSVIGVGICCNGDCLSDDLLGNDANCGGCGLSCPPGSHCVGAACEDDAGVSVSCGPGICPAGSACVAAFAGVACLPTACEADGAGCALPTAEQGECCGGRCIDPRFDSAHCNGCGDVCPADTACAFATCEPVARCVPSQDGNPCALDGGRGGICCASTCVDPEHDPQNCGDCAAICASGGSCIQGACLHPISLSPVSCYLESDAGASCSPGTACLSGNECRPLACEGDMGEADASTGSAARRVAPTWDSIPTTAGNAARTALRGSASKGSACRQPERPAALRDALPTAPASTGCACRASATPRCAPFPTPKSATAAMSWDASMSPTILKTAARARPPVLRGRPARMVSAPAPPPSAEGET